MPITNQSQRTKTDLDLSTEESFCPETCGVSQVADGLSPALQTLVKEMTASLSEVRNARVQAVRDRVRGGTYQVDNAALAQKMHHLSHHTVVGGAE